MLKIKKAHPLMGGVFVTQDKYEKDVFTNGILEPGHAAGNIKEYQTVVAVGPFVKFVKVGDVVRVDLGRYAVHRFEENSLKRDLMEDKIIRYATPKIVINDVEYLHIQENDIVYVIDDSEEVPDVDIAIVQPSIITM